MLRSRKNVGLNRLNCFYGCCPEATKAQQKRIIKRREKKDFYKALDKGEHNY